MKSATKVLLLLFAVGIISCSRPQQSSTTVVIVRHAEKASDADDSPLTEDGVRRSQALVRVAEDAGVSAIYTSQFKRSHDTAKPLSDHLGVPVTELPVNLQSPGDYGKVLAKDILDKHAGQTVLVIGHGNTIAATIEGLTGRAVSVGEIQYGDLFIVTIPPIRSSQSIKSSVWFVRCRLTRAPHQNNLIQTRPLDNISCKKGEGGSSIEEPPSPFFLH